MKRLSILFWNRQNKKEKSTRKRKRYPLQFPEDNSEEGAILQTNKPVQKLWNNQKRTTTHYNTLQRAREHIYIRQASRQLSGFYYVLCAIER